MSTTPPNPTHVMATIFGNSAVAIGYTLASKACLRVLQLPVTLLWTQAVVSAVVLIIVSRLFQNTAISIVRPWHVWRTLLPLALTRIVGALSKTACLANVDAAFYQTARGLLLPFTALLSLYFLPQTRFPPLTLLGIILVCCGFAGGIYVDLQKALSLNWGIALGVWSSFTTAVETVVLKQYSAGNDMHMLQLIYMSSVVSIVVYSPLALVFEGSTWQEIPTPTAHQFFGAALVSSVVALLLSFATWLQVKLTSPVTHTVVAATRGVLQSVLASVAFNEVIPFHRWMSTVFILGGTAIYTWSKSRDQFAYSQLPTSAGSALGESRDATPLQEVFVGDKERMEK